MGEIAHARGRVSGGGKDVDDGDANASPVPGRGEGQPGIRNAMQ